MRNYVFTVMLDEDLCLVPVALTGTYNPETMIFPFRLKDDDGEVYYYGLSSEPNSFEPLDDYKEADGCTSIEYINQYAEWAAI